MKIGIFGSEHDAQCRALAAILAQKGATPIIIEANALNAGGEASFDGDHFSYRGVSLEDVGCVFLRYVMATLPPAFEREDDYHLFRDWFVEYMQRRERFGFELSSLLVLALRDIPVVNPPEHGSVIQMKAFQLSAAKAVGLAVPHTLITNSPARVREFHGRHPAVIFKPSMGGGLTRMLDASALERLDKITTAPVTFQECLEGASIRLTMVGDRAVSAVRIRSASLDYRGDPRYAGGQQEYEDIEIPEEILEKCRALMSHAGLIFSGIDFIEKKDGTLVFLEANSSPMYLDIEIKTQNPITIALADHLLELANGPRRLSVVRPPAESFVAYALPLDPDKTAGGSEPAPARAALQGGR